MSIQSESGRIDYNKSSTGPKVAMVEGDKPVFVPLPPDSETPRKTNPGALTRQQNNKLNEYLNRKPIPPTSWKDLEE